MQKKIKIKLTTMEDITRLNHLACCFESDIDISKPTRHYISDAKSLLGIIALGTGNDYELTIHAINEDEYVKFINTFSVFTE